MKNYGGCQLTILPKRIDGIGEWLGNIIYKKASDEIADFEISKIGPSYC